MRVLFACIPMLGHFQPMVPLGWALRTAGHEVTVAVPESFQSEVISTGLPAVACAAAFDPRPLLEEMLQNPDWKGPNSGGTQARRRARSGAMELAERLLPGTDEIVRDWRPDVIVAEPTSFAARATAACHGVPFVEHWWGLALPAHIRAGVDRAVAFLAKRPDLPKPRMTIDVCPPSFQAPHADPTHRMRYVPYSGHAEVPRWALTRSDRPRACVTLGTAIHWLADIRQTLNQVREALSAAGMRMVLGTTDAPAAEALRGHPDVEAVGRLPLDQILPVCDLLVHHAGSGVSLTAITHGLPQVVIPHMSDQIPNAERLEKVGVALRMEPEDVSVASLGRAVAAVVDDTSYAANARTLADEVRAQPLPSSLVRELERLVDKGP